MPKSSFFIDDILEGGSKPTSMSNGSYLNKKKSFIASSTTNGSQSFLAPKKPSSHSSSSLSPSSSSSSSEENNISSSNIHHAFGGLSELISHSSNPAISPFLLNSFLTSQRDESNGTNMLLAALLQNLASANATSQAQMLGQYYSRLFYQQLADANQNSGQTQVN
jgi:hypothetical protein